MGAGTTKTAAAAVPSRCGGQGDATVVAARSPPYWKLMLVALDDLSIRMGDLLTLAGAVFFAIQISVASIYGRDLDVNVSTFWMFVTVAVVCSVPTVMLEPAQVAGVVWAPSLVGVTVT